MTDLNHTAGMGLWLVYWIADRSGGKLTFNTNADGNEVTITVPNADCDPTLPEADQIPPPETAVRPAATEPDGGTPFRSSESVFGADIPESSTDPNASHDLFSGETDD
jgi:hypothetical protein